jgi:hypothetical protein
MWDSISARFSRGAATGTTTRRVSQKEAWRSHVCSVRQESGSQRFNASSVGVGRTKRDAQNIGAHFETAESEHGRCVSGLGQRINHIGRRALRGHAT